MDCGAFAWMVEHLSRIPYITSKQGSPKTILCYSVRSRGRTPAAVILAQPRLKGIYYRGLTNYLYYFGGFLITIFAV